MQLDTSYLGIRLAHPFVAGASPLGYRLDTIKRLEDAGCDAVGAPHHLHVPLKTPTSMTTALSTLRVLVVDDEPLIRWAVSETLGQEGYQVIEAGDAAGAIHALSAGPAPDVVLLDFRLPDSNDLRLLATVRRLAPAAAVVMMTAVGDAEMIAGAEALGASRVVGKPIDMRDLETVIRTAAESR